MPDPRFFDSLGPLTLGALAASIDARLEGGPAGTAIDAVAPIASARPGQVCALYDRRYAPALGATGASAVILHEADADAVPTGVARLITRSPQAGYARAAALLHAPRLQGDKRVSPDAELEDGRVTVGPGAVVGPGARIGRGTRIGANAVIGPGVCVGRDCEIGAGAVIGFALIGDRVRILSNAVIGEQGFGVAAGDGGALDVPQLGRVIIQDGVTVGACACIDRGAYGDTVIGENAKIDNLVQVAHNVRIGRNCVLAAHVGISGSVVVEDGAMFGGRAGVVDHRRVGAGAKVGAAAAVMSDIPGGETWSGYPARPLARTLRESAWVARQARRGRRPTGREGE